MKTLHRPSPCQVLLEPDGTGGVWVSAVRWRGTTWRVRLTLEVWCYWGDWWLDAGLIGEQRSYHVLGTQKGEITIFYRQQLLEALCGWFVAGWYD